MRTERVIRVVYTTNGFSVLFVWFFVGSEILCFLISFSSFGGQKKQKPSHAERAVGSFFVHKLPLWQHSSVERALSLKPVVCFSGIAELPCQRAEYKLACNYKRAQPVVGTANIISRLSTLVCITHVQTVLTLFPKNSRALTVLFNGAGWFLYVTLCVEKCKGYLRTYTAR